MSCTSILPKLTWLAVPLLCSVAFSATARAPFEIIDANGKAVGPILGRAGSTASVPFRFADRRIVLEVHRLGFAYSGNLYFESTDCTGQPYLHTRSIDVLTPSAVRGAQRTLHVPDGSSLYVTAHSYSFPSGDTEYCRPISPALYDPFRVARPAVDLGGLFTPPFRVSASPDLIDLDASAP